MTAEQIQNIEKVVQDYRKIKNELQEKKREIEKLRDENRINDWIKLARIDNLYEDFAKTPERIEFLEMAKKAEIDDDFERYFRAAHLKSFFGIIVDPLNL